MSIEIGLTKTDEPGLLGAGEMTPEKAERIADYVREALTRTDAVELWTVWLSEYDPPRIKERRVPASDFTGADVEDIFSASLLARRRHGKPVRRRAAHISPPARGAVSGLRRILPENNAKSPCNQQGLLL